MSQALLPELRESGVCSETAAEDAVRASLAIVRDGTHDVFRYLPADRNAVRRVVGRGAQRSRPTEMKAGREDDRRHSCDWVSARHGDEERGLTDVSADGQNTKGGVHAHDDQSAMSNLMTGALEEEDEVGGDAVNIHAAARMRVSSAYDEKKR